MATLTVQEITRVGLAPAFSAAAGGGDQFANNGRCFHEAKCADASSKTVNYVVQQKVDGLSVTNLSITVPATTGDRMTGSFPPDIYNDANGNVQVTYSAVTSVTGGAFRLT